MGPTPQIVSRPPALDPDAEIWAAHFEAPATERNAGALTVTAEHVPEQGGRRRWKTQAMGSMVPLDTVAKREEPQRALTVDAPLVEAVSRQAPTPNSSTTIQHDVPFGWRPTLDPSTPEITTLRDALVERASAQRVTLLVTGASTAERARIAGALGLAIAELGARVLLVEADFDTPELHRALDFTAAPGAGFSQQLMARRVARQAEPWVVTRCSANLQVLAEGRFRSPGLVASREFENAIHELREQHDVVLIHAPALTRPEDLQPLGALAHGVIVVQPGRVPSLIFGADALRGLL